MTPTPPDLRLPAPEIEPPDHLVHQLAEMARSSVPSIPAWSRRRAGVVAGATAAAVLASVGGAWATGVLEVPGLPSPIRQAPAPVSPVVPTDDDGQRDTSERGTPEEESEEGAGGSSDSQGGAGSTDREKKSDDDKGGEGDKGGDGRGQSGQDDSGRGSDKGSDKGKRDKGSEKPDKDPGEKPGKDKDRDKDDERDDDDRGKGKEATPQKKDAWPPEDDRGPVVGPESDVRR